MTAMWKNTASNKHCRRLEAVLLARKYTFILDGAFYFYMCTIWDVISAGQDLTLTTFYSWACIYEIED